MLRKQGCEKYLIVFLIAISCHIAWADPPEQTFAGLQAPNPVTELSLTSTSNDWYKDAVIYHLWVAAFRDSDGNGIGDVKGITSSLDTLKELGVNTLWLSPFFASSSSNRNLHGYDVIDHYQVDPRLGTKEDMLDLVREAHARGIRLLLDFVPNHLSSRHPWFLESKNRSSSKRDWFVWRDDKPTKGWTGFDQQSDWYESDGSYYYGIFWSGMPDVNHRNPHVRLELAKAARFWLDQGFDGMRIDAVRYMFENFEGSGEKSDQEDQPESIAWFQAWRDEVLEPYTPLGYPKIMVAENWTEDRRSLNAYLSSGNRPVFHMTLNFALLAGLKTLDANATRELWEWDATLGKDAWLANFVSNHDLAADRPGTIFADDPSRLRAQAAWLLLGPGTPIVYYGNEIGQRQGPQRGDTKHRQPLDWKEVDHQSKDDESIWSWHQKLIATRLQHESLRRGKAILMNSNQEGQKIIVLGRLSGDDTTLAIFNGSSSTITDLLVDTPFTGHKIRSVFDDEVQTLDESRRLRIEALAPYETKVFCESGN